MLLDDGNYYMDTYPNFGFSVTMRDIECYNCKKVMIENQIWKCDILDFYDITKVYGILMKKVL